ncbi:MAG: LysR family transcriptional regulator [Azospirillaceae bacterium]
MNIRHIESFVWLCRLRSFRKTAQRLNVSQPAVSSRLETLEKELGCRLIDRGRGVSLTSEGQLFLPYAERIVRLYAEAKSDLTPTTGIRGRVRLGIIDTVTETWLPDMVERLRRDHPALVLDIVADTSQRLLAGLEDGAINAAFTLALPPDPRLTQVPICRFAMRWFAAPGMAGDRVLSRDELERLPIITYPAGTPPNAILDRFFERKETWLVHQSSANSLMTMVRLVADGLGIAAMPPAALLNEIAAGTLAELATADALDPISIVAASLTDRPSPVIEAVISAARDAVAAFIAEAGPAIGAVQEVPAESG